MRRRRSLRACSLLIALCDLAFVSSARAVICIVPSVPHPTVERAIADLSCTTIDLGTGIFSGLLLVPRTVTMIGDGTVQTILAGPLIAQGAGTIVTLRQLRIDGTQPSSSGCPGPALVTAGGARILAPQPIVVTDTAAVSGSCTLFADGFETGNLNGWS